MSEHEILQLAQNIGIKKTITLLKKQPVKNKECEIKQLFRKVLSITCEQLSIKQKSLSTGLHYEGKRVIAMMIVAMTIIKNFKYKQKDIAIAMCIKTQRISLLKKDFYNLNDKIKTDKYIIDSYKAVRQKLINKQIIKTYGTTN